MKIAIIVSTFPPYRAGIGNVAWRNALALNRLGHEVEVFTPDYGSKEKFAGIKVNYLKPVFKYGQAALILGLAKKLKAGNFDAINVHLPAGFNLAEGVLWAKLTGRIKKYAVYYHMDIVGHGFKKLLYGFYSHLIMPGVIKSAAVVTVTSMDYGLHSNLAKMIKQNKAKFIELPNGADTELFAKRSKNQELLEKYNLIDSQVIGFVGGLDSNHYFKGVDVLIEAFKLLVNGGENKIKLLIIGTGNLLEDYQKLAKKLGLEDKVVFTGFVKDEDLPYHYNLMDILVLPSIDKSEAFGMVLVEAMACGVPVVASDLPGVRSVVDREENGLLAKPKDKKDLADKLGYLIRNKEVARGFGNNGLEKAKGKYSWQVIAKQLAGILEKAKNL